MEKKIKDQSGVTFIEILITSAILSIMAIGLFSAVNYLQNASKKSVNMSNTDRMISGLLDNVRDNINLYQANFQDSESKDENMKLNKEKYLNPDNLPMAWAEAVYTEVKNCPKCPGRFGYIIQPFTGYRGMYLVTVRVKHPDLANGGAQDYEFVVTGK